MSTPVQLATPVETPWRRLDPRMLVIGVRSSWLTIDRKSSLMRVAR